MIHRLASAMAGGPELPQPPLFICAISQLTSSKKSKRLTTIGRFLREAQSLRSDVAQYRHG